MRMKKIICTQNGWSLVEVITVLIIIVVAAAFAAPDIITWGENTRVTSAARDLVADLNNARVAAVDENSNVVMNLDVANDNYIIFLDNGGPAGAGIANNDTLEIDVDGTTRLETVIGEKNFTDDNYRGAVINNSTIAAPFGFNPRGLPLDGHTGDILIRNSDSDVWLKIVVSSAGALTLLKSNNSTDGTDGTWK